MYKRQDRGGRVQTGAVVGGDGHHDAVVVDEGGHDRADDRVVLQVTAGEAFGVGAEAEAGRDDVGLRRLVGGGEQRARDAVGGGLLRYDEPVVGARRDAQEVGVAAPGGPGTLPVVGERRHHAEVQQDLVEGRVLVLRGGGAVQATAVLGDIGGDQRHRRQVEVALPVFQDGGRAVGAYVGVAGVGHRLVGEVADGDVGDGLPGRRLLSVPLPEQGEGAGRVHPAGVEEGLRGGGEGVVGRHRARCPGTGAPARLRRRRAGRRREGTHDRRVQRTRPGVHRVDVSVRFGVRDAGRTPQGPGDRDGIPLTRAQDVRTGRRAGPGSPGHRAQRTRPDGPELGIERGDTGPWQTRGDAGPGHGRAGDRRLPVQGHQDLPGHHALPLGGGVHGGRRHGRRGRRGGGVGLRRARGKRHQRARRGQEEDGTGSDDPAGGGTCVWHRGTFC